MGEFPQIDPARQRRLPNSWQPRHNYEKLARLSRWARKMRRLPFVKAFTRKHIGEHSSWNRTRDTKCRSLAPRTQIFRWGWGKSACSVNRGGTGWDQGTRSEAFFGELPRRGSPLSSVPCIQVACRPVAITIIHRKVKPIRVTGACRPLSPLSKGVTPSSSVTLTRRTIRRKKSAELFSHYGTAGKLWYVTALKIRALVPQDKEGRSVFSGVPEADCRWR